MTLQEKFEMAVRVGASAVRREVEAERVIESLACALFDGGDPVAAFDQWFAWATENEARFGHTR